MPKTSPRAQAFAERFPARLAALKDKMGYSWYGLARQWDVTEGRLFEYRHGHRLPPGYQLLDLVRIAREVEGGLDLLLTDFPAEEQSHKGMECE